MLKDSEVSDLRGAATLKTIGRKQYWYDRFRLGTEVVDRYVGEGTQALRERLARHEEIARELNENERQRARLMRVLRAEDYLMADAGTGQVVSAMGRAGVFRLGERWSARRPSECTRARSAFGSVSTSRP